MSAAPRLRWAVQERTLGAAEDLDWAMDELAAFRAYADAFPDDSGRQAHLSGQVAQALADNTGTLFAQPTIEPVDVIAEKPPT